MKPAVCFALALTACSALDPSVGPLYVPTPFVSDAAGGEGDVETDGDDIPPWGVSFALDIRPMIERPSSRTEKKGCKSCHYRTEVSHNGIDLGGFDMTTLAAIRRGGGSSRGRIIVAGKPDESALVQVLRGSYGWAPRMPKNSAVFWSDEDIQKVADWIAQGAHGASGE